MQHRPTIAKIDLDALAHNLRETRRFVGTNVLCMAVVKADAYGHGAIECSRRLETEGVDWFGVAIPEEGVELRKAGIERPILCLGSFWPGQEPLVVEHDLTPVVFDLERAAALSQHLGDEEYDIHVKIDTGMGRLGVRWTDAAEFARGLKGFPNLNVAGIMSHFASADDPKQDEFTARQIARFNESCRAFEQEGFSPRICDIANSPGSIRCTDSRKGMVRLGGALYGLLDDILPEHENKPQLKPVLSLVSCIAHIKHVPAGEGLGYGQTFHTKRDSVIALVPIGYADGYPRGESNSQSAITGGCLVPVVGRVSMDWTILDVTDVRNAVIGDEVNFIGSDGGHKIKASDLARTIGTIGYEITCGISPRVPRIFT
ncbi:MAG TPA: alanine racemase [Pyrinomonadaceae bacterium]|jgi:alanine racemase|nr:alanine racemase [Pyrinomonadaceae bacterium]